MNIRTSDVKELREQTGVGLMDCKNALREAEGSLEKALEILRLKGLAIAAKKAGREASEGIIGSYIHTGGKLGVLVEVNCETDFVAKTDEFQEFVRDIAMHIAASNPAYLKKEDIPSEVVEKEKEIYRSQVTDKPPQVVEKIVDGKLDRFYRDHCLLDQVHVKDPEQKKSVQEILVDTVAKLGENVVIKRFVRFQLGEKID